MIKETTKYYDCQKRGIEFLHSKKYALLAFEQGLGKTLTSLSNKDLDSNSRVLVVCPAYLVFNWIDEIKLHTNFDLNNFSVMSYERMTKNCVQLCTKNFDYIIFDESHYLKNKDAKRTKSAFQLVASLKPKNLALLTGTPAKNKVESLWSQIRILSLGREIKNFPLSLTSFKNTFIDYEVIDYGHLTVFKERGIKNPELLRDLLKDSMLIEKVKDNLDLPEAVANLITMNNSLEDGLLSIAFENAKQNIKDLEKTHISSFKRDIAILKTEVTIAYIKDFVQNNPDKSLVVFSCHPDAVKTIGNSLKGAKVSHYLVDQSLSSEKRNNIKNSFQAGDKKILLATIGTFSTGVTLTQAHHMIFNDYPWDSDDLDQAKSRIRRIGQKLTCFYSFVVLGAFDKKILSEINSKKKIKGEIGL